jgi:hypothetical protein
MTEDSGNSEMLRELQRETAGLPREIAPPEEAWKKIKAQIDLEAQLVATMPLHSRERAFWQRPAFLAAAALLLVAGASLMTALVIGRRMIDRTASPVARVNPAPAPAPQPEAALAEFTAKENDFITVSNQLSAIIESGKTELSPETIAKLKQSVSVIDGAILEARRALAADPGNKVLIEMLSASYNQKVDLLRRTSAMGES